MAVVRAAAERAGRDPAGLRFVCRGAVKVRPAGLPDRAPLTGSLAEIRSDFDDLAGAGITAPLPIQAATLPDTLAGRDVLGRGPLLDRLLDANSALLGDHVIGKSIPKAYARLEKQDHYQCGKRQSGPAPPA